MFDLLSTNKTFVQILKGIFLKKSIIQPNNSSNILAKVGFYFQLSYLFVELHCQTFEILLIKDSD